MTIFQKLKKIIFSSSFFFISLSFLIIFLNFLPYLHAYLITPPDKEFMGAIFLPADYNFYMSVIDQGKEGRWDFIYFYEPSISQPVPIFYFYLTMGHLAKIIGVSAPVIYFLFLVLLSVSLVAAIYLFLRKFIADIFLRKIIFALLLFGSGFGWFFYSLPKSVFSFLESRYIIPIDFLSPAAMPVLRFSFKPHYLLADILLIASVWLLLVYFEKRKKSLIVWAGSLIFILNFVLPLHSAVLYLTLLLYCFLRIATERKPPPFDYKLLAAVLLISAFPLILILKNLLTNPIVYLTEYLSVVRSPSPLGHIIGYGVIFILGAYGIMYSIKKLNYFTNFLMAWLTAIVFLSFLPINNQGRFFEAAPYIPISIFAGIGLYELRHLWLKSKKYASQHLALSGYKTFVIFIVLFSFFSSIAILGKFWKSNSRFPPLQYLDRDKKEAMEWLSRNSPTDAVVLSSQANGNFMPYLAKRYAYLGSDVIYNHDERFQETESFYYNTFSEKDALNFLNKNGIKYVFYSDDEKNLAQLKIKDFYFYSFDQKNGKSQNGKSVENYGFLEKIYQNNKVKIYKVN